MPYVLVENSRRALAVMAANYYGHPADSMTMVAVTGTNGKTTTTYLLKAILEQELGAKVGLIGTNQDLIGDEVVPTERTTPESLELQELFARMRSAPIRQRSLLGMSHIPEDRHKHGLVLDYTLEDNMVLQRYFEPQFVSKAGFLKRKAIREYANRLIEQYDVRSGQGPVTVARSMSGGNQQKAIIAREIDKDPELLIAVQPTRGLDVGAIEYIHKQIVAQRDAGKAVLLVSLELDEVMSLSDRILVIYEGEIVGELDPKTTTAEEMGLYMAGAKRKGA